jgi:hypothetical protein
MDLLEFFGSEGSQMTENINAYSDKFSQCSLGDWMYCCSSVLSAFPFHLRFNFAPIFEPITAYFKLWHKKTNTLY